MSHRLKIDFRDENFKIHHLVDIYQVYTNYTPEAKNGSAAGVTIKFFRIIMVMLHIKLKGMKHTVAC